MLTNYLSPEWNINNKQQRHQQMIPTITVVDAMVINRSSNYGN